MAEFLADHGSQRIWLRYPQSRRNAETAQTHVRRFLYLTERQRQLSSKPVLREVILSGSYRVVDFARTNASWRASYKIGAPNICTGAALAPTDSYP